MKRSHFLLFTGLAAALVALVWQARMITDLRAEVSSFGPSMTLAKDLLEKGEHETVLQYLEMRGKFWQSSELEKWTKEIHAGRIPDFKGSPWY